MAFKDPHSCWVPGAAQIRHIEFNLDVDFDKHVLRGWADYHFTQPIGATLELDTRDIQVDTVIPLNGDKRSLAWSFGEPNVFGSVLTITGAEGLSGLRIRFATSPQSTALQWLAPEQTAGKKHPFMFSQCQAILARSVFPCHDTPAVRFTYDATLRVPRALTAVMAAESKKVVHEPEGTMCSFHMRHPIPSYLFALAAGNISAEKIGARSRVFAEPEMVKAAAWEFAEVDKMIDGAEALFGEYIWDRFDLLLMPPSFPYGGMENPTLTFLTPTLIAGDRSLVAVVAHELAHSWTGNLVTNATWEDFWLNEGWTVYAERRIIERLYGLEYTNLQAVNGRNSLVESMQVFGADSPYTRLKTDLAGIDPDEVFSSVPYEKGYLLLVALERAVGREKFDKFILGYIDDFKFTSITTDRFVDYLHKHLPEAVEKVDLDTWIHQPNLPEHAPSFSSHLIDEVRQARARWDKGERDLAPTIRPWIVHQKVLFLEELPQKQSYDDCAHLERLFEVETTANNEILLPWYCIAAASTYQKAFPQIRAFLGEVGRGKYLRPLYRALHTNPETRLLAQELFDEFKDRYHSVARGAVQRILATKPASVDA